MKLSIQSHSLIESALKKATSKFNADNEQTVVTDIHLQPKQGSGELFIFDDDDEELSQTTIDEWIEYEKDDFYEDVERLLRTSLSKMQEAGVFASVTILKPYSFVLVDEDKETVTELLLIDDDMFMMNDELLKGLNEELDEFLNELLTE